MNRYICIISFILISVEVSGQSGWSSAREVNISRTPMPTAPADLKISDVTFSDEDGNWNNTLDADEKAELRFNLSNIGRGKAFALAANIKSLNLIKGLQLLIENELGNLDPGKSIRIAIPIAGLDFLETGKAELELKINEANGFDSDPIRVLFNTQNFKNPDLSIADYNFARVDGGNVALGHPISLTVTLENTGLADASDVQISFRNPENVFPAAEANFYIEKLKPNEKRSIVYEFFGNKKYDGNDIPIEILVIESNNNINESRILRMALDQEASQPQTVTITSRVDELIENIPLHSVDIDIPSTRRTVQNRFALIIGNEDYQKYQMGLQTDQNVLFARNDALVFKEYAINTLGVPAKHTFILTDATRGQMSREIERVTALAKLTPNSEIIFYYAGHGLPDFETHQSYLIPVDVAASTLFDAISLRDLYAKFASSNASRIIVFLDACFSGGGRGENGLLAARTVKIRPKSDIIGGNIVVFAATSGKEVSLPLTAQSHGLFTYYLLKKFQETKGGLNLDELGQHLEQEIPKASLLENGLLQRPQVLISPDLDEKWMLWKF